MSTDRPFLDDILSNPDDDAVRLIYADWLDDHGDPARAEFIRTQIELERLTADPDADSQRVATLRAREHRLLAAHYQNWTPPVVLEHARRWVYHRGFAEGVTFGPGELLRHADALRSSCPLRSLELEGHQVPAGVGEAVARWPGLSTVRDLRFSGVTGGNPYAVVHEFIPTLRSPFLTRLCRLNLCGFPIEWAVVEALGTRAAAGVEELTVTGVRITDETVNALTRGLLALLCRLSLWSPNATEDADRRLLLSPTGKQLTEFTVGTVIRSDQLPEAYGEAFEYSSLRSLGLSGCPPLLEEFLSAEPTGLLTSLDLSGNDLHGGRVREVAMSPWLPCVCGRRTCSLATRRRPGHGAPTPGRRPGRGPAPGQPAGDVSCRWACPRR